MNRDSPNILVTGTPGCGKSSHSKKLKELLSYELYSISEIAKEKGFIEKYDEVLDTSVVDEDKLLDFMEVELVKGGNIIDWHVCDIFPERLIDLVVVLTTDNSILYDRLKARGYKKNKIDENIDAEIMQVILQEAKESYEEGIVVVLESNTEEDMESNVGRIGEWVENWKKDHPEGVSGEKVEKEVESEDEGEEGEEEEEEEEEEEDDEEDYDEDEEQESEEDEEEEVEESDEEDSAPPSKKQKK